MSKQVVFVVLRLVLLRDVVFHICLFESFVYQLEKVRLCVVLFMLELLQLELPLILIFILQLGLHLLDK